MAKSKIGFHTGPGGKKQGLGDWERKLNKAGQAFGMKAVDEYGPIGEALSIGRESGVENWLGFRYTKASGKVSREVPEYDADPRIDAPKLCQEVVDKLPPEFDQAVWLEIINEPRAQNKGDDTMFAGMNACDYLGEWCLAAAKFLNANGYRFMGPSFNSGEPGREGLPLEDAVTQYSQPGMLKYLAYCADNPDKAALSVHEYSWSNWKEGQTAADWYPSLWGRFEAAIAAADFNGIPRKFPIFVSEFGFAHNEAPSGRSAYTYLDARNQMTARWPQLKCDASWTLQQGWGAVDANVNTWLKYEAGKEFGEGQQPAATHASFGGTSPGAEPVKPVAPEEGEEDEGETEAPAGPGASEFESIGTKVVTPEIGLWLRTGPSRDFDKIKLMKQGTTVEVIEEGAWDFVRLGGDNGYAASQYLRPETDNDTPVVTGAYHYHGPPVKFHTGLHGPAGDAAWNWPGFKDKITELNLPLVFMSNGINPDFAGMGDPVRNVVRLYWNPEKVTADRAYETIRDDQLKRWWEKGARRFIFFNEPQLTRKHGQSEEGMKIAWNSAEAFAKFLRTCLSRAKEEFEGIYLYTTPVTPNGAFSPWIWRRAIWKHNQKVVDGWCMHAYSGNNSDASTAVNEILDQVKKLQREFRLQIPVIVSEASVNRGDDAEQKAKVALLLAERAAAIPGLEAVFWFAADWDPGFDVHNEGWFRKGIADAYLRLRDG